MRDRFQTPTSAALLALFLALPGAALANEPVAKIENAGEALVFHPVMEAESYTLTVTGPCDYYEQISSEKGELVFKVSEDTFDGVYDYSVVATPVIDRRVKRAMLEARETGDRREVRRLCRDGRLPDAAKLTQSGSFMLVGGKLVFDEMPEAERKSDRDGRE